MGREREGGSERERGSERVCGERHTQKEGHSPRLTNQREREEEEGGILKESQAKAQK